MGATIFLKTWAVSVFPFIQLGVSKNHLKKICKAVLINDDPLNFRKKSEMIKGLFWNLFSCFCSYIQLKIICQNFRGTRIFLMICVASGFTIYSFWGQ